MTDISRCSNLRGELAGQPEVAGRLLAFLKNPTPEAWDDVYTLVVQATGHITLWQAVCVLDHSFPRKRDGNWQIAPSAFVVRRAIQLAADVAIVKGK